MTKWKVYEKQMMFNRMVLALKVLTITGFVLLAVIMFQLTHLIHG